MPSLINLLRGPFTYPRVYVRIDKEKLFVKTLPGGKSLEGTTKIAFCNETNKVTAVGDPVELRNVQNQNCRVIDWFNHIDKKIVDYKAAELALRYYMRHTFSSEALLGAVIFFHPQERIAVFESYELSHFEEMKNKLGVLRIYIWTGDILTDRALLRGEFNGNHWQGRGPRLGRIQYPL